MPSAERRRQIVGGLTRPSPIAALLFFSSLRRIIGPDSFPRIRITKAVFMSHRFTIGVEEEFQIIDPISGELRSHVSELIAASSAEAGEQIKPELHQSIGEMGRKLCTA